MTALSASDLLMPAEKAGVTRVWPVALAGLGVWLAAIAINAPLKLDHDVSYFVASGHALNQGAKLYVDWIDFNTTAPSGLARFSDWVSSFLGTPLDLTHKGTIFSLALLGLSVAFLAALPLLRTPGLKRWVLAIGVPAVLMFATPEIGRREHLMSIGVTGWTLAILLAAEGVRRPRLVEIAVGVVAGLALYMKPHFILFSVVLGLIDLVRGRGRPLLATWTAAGVSGTLYLWLVLANPAFLGVMLPMTVDLYSPLQTGKQLPINQLLAALPNCLVMAAAIVLFLVSGAKRPSGTALAVFGGLLVAGAALHVQQSFGFRYQHLPFDIAFAMSVLALLYWMLSQEAPAAPKTRLIRIAGAGAGALLFAGAGPAMAWILDYPHRSSISDTPFVRSMTPPKPSDAVMFFTTDHHPAAEALTMIPAHNASGFVSLFPIAMLMEQDGKFARRIPLSADKRARWTPWFRKIVADRFCANPPVRAAVDRTPASYFIETPGLDYLRWLRDDPRFEACWRASGLKPTGKTYTMAGRTYQFYAAPPR